MSCNSPTHGTFNPLINKIAHAWEKSGAVFSAFGGIGSLALGVWTALPSKWDLWKISIVVLLFIFTAFCLFVAPVASLRLQKTFKSYETTIHNLEGKLSQFEDAREQDIAKMREIFHRVGRRFLEECQIYNSHTRISLYQHEPQEKCFILLERVSKNPDLSIKGRPTYPDNQGFISTVWTRGKGDQLIKAVDSEKWSQRQYKDFSIPLETARAIKMKSRSFVGISLLNENEKSVGLIIIESTKYNSIPGDVLDKVEQHRAYEQLALMLTVTPHLPKNYFSEAN